MKRLRNVKSQVAKIRVAKVKSKEEAQLLVKLGKLSLIRSFGYQCTEEQELRANPLGSEAFKRIYPDQPMTRAEIKSKFSSTKSN